MPCAWEQTVLISESLVPGSPMSVWLIGILSRISGVLAAQKIGIFAVSTYNTDYILVKDENFARAVDALTEAGYIVV